MLCLFIRNSFLDNIYISNLIKFLMYYFTSSKPVIQHLGQHSKNCWKSLGSFKDVIHFSSKQRVLPLEITLKRNCRRSFCEFVSSLFHSQHSQLKQACFLRIFGQTITGKQNGATDIQKQLVVLEPRTKFEPQVPS